MGSYKEELTMIFAVCVTGITVVTVVTVGIVFGMNVYQNSQVAQVEACTSNGGSWVAGPLGFECRQKGSQ